MTDRIKAGGQQARQQRLQATLRENLVRRKAQARKRGALAEKGADEHRGGCEVKGRERS